MPYPVQILINTDRTITARSYNSSGGQLWLISSIDKVTVGIRNSLALSRENNILRLFLNGNIIGTTTYSGNLPIESNNISIGGYNNGQYTANGYIDELRITIGVARRTSTYIVETKPFPNF